MSQITFQPGSTHVNTTGLSDQEYRAWRWYVLPLIVVFAIDLLTPQFVNWGLVPRAVSWIGDAALMGMIVIAIMRMLLLDRIPKVFLVVLAATLLGMTVALYEGQGLTVSLYGWRRLFQYPLVGLYVYLMPQWPALSARFIMRLTLLILAFEVVFQIGQFFAGQTPGDHLAGSFGRFGVGPLIMYIMIVVGFGFGRWLVQGDWRYLLVTVVLGIVASSLGQMKIYPLAVLLFALVSFMIQLLRGGQLRRLFMVMVIILIGTAAYAFVFNTVVAPLNQKQFQDYLDLDVIDHYLTRGSGSANVGFSLNRNTEPVYVWNKNLDDPVSFLFGNGIGSRAQSATLGLAGGWYDSSLYQGGPGRSLPMLLQETGVLGLFTFAAFILVTVIALYRRAGENGRTDFAAVQYGLLLYTVFWPMWIWYLPVWLQAVPMLLYWGTLGFALSPQNNSGVQAYAAAASPAADQRDAGTVLQSG